MLMQIMHGNGSVYYIIICVYNLYWLSESLKHVKENRCCRFFPEHFCVFFLIDNDHQIIKSTKIYQK